MPPTTLPTPPAEYMTNWLLAAIAVGMVALWAWSKLRAKGKLGIEQPLEVREAAQWATKKELQELEAKQAAEMLRLHARVSKVGDELVAAQNAINAGGENRAAQIQRRLDEQQKQIGEIPMKVADLISKLKQS